MDQTNIFEGERIRLTDIDPKEDAEKDSQWMHSIEYARFRTENPVRPMSVSEVSKDLEEKLKESDQERSSFYYAVRLKTGEKDLLGFLHIIDIEWPNGQGLLQVLMGTEEIKKEYLEEALSLALRYAFDELNLYHIFCEIPSYDIDVIKAFEKAGFAQEACLREMVYHAGEYHDRIMFGIVGEEWRQKKGLS